MTETIWEQARKALGCLAVELPLQVCQDVGSVIGAALDAGEKAERDYAECLRAHCFDAFDELKKSRDNARASERSAQAAEAAAVARAEYAERMLLEERTEADAWRAKARDKGECARALRKRAEKAERERDEARKAMEDADSERIRLARECAQKAEGDVERLRSELAAELRDGDLWRERYGREHAWREKAEMERDEARAARDALNELTRDLRMCAESAEARVKELEGELD